MWVGRSRSLACVWTSQLSGTKPSSGALGTVQRGRALASGRVCHCMLAPTPTVALCVRGQAEAVRVQLLVIESCPRRSLWPQRPEALLGLCRDPVHPKVASNQPTACRGPFQSGAPAPGVGRRGLCQSWVCCRDLLLAPAVGWPLVPTGAKGPLVSPLQADLLRPAALLVVDPLKSGAGAPRTLQVPQVSFFRAIFLSDNRGISTRA